MILLNILIQYIICNYNRNITNKSSNKSFQQKSIIQNHKYENL